MGTPAKIKHIEGALNADNDRKNVFFQYTILNSILIFTRMSQTYENIPQQNTYFEGISQMPLKKIFEYVIQKQFL